MTISLSIGGKEQLSQTKMMTFSTIKTNGLFAVVVYKNLYGLLQLYLRAIVKLV